MNTITDGIVTVTPTLIDGYESTRRSGSLFHEVPGLEWPDVVLRPSGPRTGRLRLVFADASAESDSLTAELLHAAGGVLTLISTERTSVDMDYVVSGDIIRALDPVTRDAWVLTVDFTEVEPAE